MTTINYISTPCGTGKSQWALTHIASTENNYVFVIDKIALINEMTERLQELNPDIELYEVHSKTSKIPVVDQMLAWANDVSFKQLKHSVLFVTHAGFCEADWSFANDIKPEVIIDEAINLWTFSKWRIPLSYKGWAQAFNLQDHGLKGWSKLYPKENISDLKVSYSDDDSFMKLSHILRKAKFQNVLIDIKSWDECSTKKEIRLFHLMDPVMIQNFSSMTILAANFEISLTKSLLEHMGYKMNEIHPFEIPKWNQRDVVIHYFSKRHASRYYFNSKHQPLQFVQKYINVNITDKFIWLKNTCTEISDLSLDGKLIQPKSHGTNKLDEYHTAIGLYSAKPDKHEQSFFEQALGISLEQIVDSREIDILYQFVMRSSLRKPDSTEPVTIYVFDIHQAEKLAKLLPCESVINYIDLELPGQDFDEPKPRTFKDKSRKEYMREYMKARRDKVKEHEQRVALEERMKDLNEQEIRELEQEVKVILIPEPVRKLELKVGNINDARFYGTLEWVTAVLGAIGPFDEDAGIKDKPYHVQRFHDILAGPGAPTLQDIKEILEFTGKLNHTDKLFVHCHAGISRSTALAIGVLIQHGYSIPAAFKYVEEDRPVLSPNATIITYLDELLDLEGELKSYFTQWKSKRITRDLNSEPNYYNN